MRPNFFHHLHPPTIPAAQARWRYTLGAGGLSVYLLAVLFVTGMLEMFYYVPTPEQAALSVQTLTFHVPFGALVRNMHFWAGQAQVITALMHLIRVLMTGAYAPPRRFNFLLGLILFVMLVALDWSGYILRWDEAVRWALVVGTQLIKSAPGVGGILYRVVVGGSDLGPATLTRFYGWHIFALILALVVGVTWHLFRVRRDGGISAPPAGQRLGAARITRFELAQRELVAALVATSILVLFSTFVAAPIAQPVKSFAQSSSSAETYAPWFFLWVQALVRLGDPFWLGVALPLGVVLTIAALPFLFPTVAATEQGRWFPRSARSVQLVVGGLMIVILLLTLWGRWP